MQVALIRYDWHPYKKGRFWPRHTRGEPIRRWKQRAGWCFCEPSKRFQQTASHSADALTLDCWSILQRHDETRTSSEHPSWAQVLWTTSLLHDLTLLYGRMPFAREGLRFICTACNWTPYPVPCLKCHLKNRIPIVCSLGGWRLWSSAFSYFLDSWGQSSPQWQNLFALVHLKNTVISMKREREAILQWFL